MEKEPMGNIESHKPEKSLIAEVSENGTAKVDIDQYSISFRKNESGKVVLVAKSNHAQRNNFVPESIFSKAYDAAKEALRKYNPQQRSFELTQTASKDVAKKHLDEIKRMFDS